MAVHKCPIPLKAPEPVKVKKNRAATAAQKEPLWQTVCMNIASIHVTKPITKYGNGIKAGADGPNIDKDCLGNRAPKFVKLKNEAASCLIKTKT